MPGIPLGATNKHFCLRCGLQMHAPCGVDSDEDGNEVVEEINLNDVTSEEIDELCSQLAKISGELKRLKCDNNEFGGIASKVADASSSLRLAHNRFERNRVTKKQLKAPRQARLTPFFKR